MRRLNSPRIVYFCGLFPPEAVGGQGWPVGVAPGVAEFPWLFPEVEGDEPEFDEPELPELDEPELEDPVFGVELLGAPGVPGKVPHGDPFGLVPGALEVFGFTVEG